MVLVHGVGFGPALFDPLAGRLADTHCVIVPARRGYSSAVTHAPDGELALGTHVADLLDLLDGLGIDRAFVVGVSGGASIVTALALKAPARIVGAIAHEPLVGSLTPQIHTRIRRMAAAMRRTGDTEAFGRALAGPDTWSRMAPGDREGPTRWAAAVRAEAPGFLAFEPTADQLSVLSAVRFVTTVGERSGPERHAAAASLRRATHVRVRTVTGAGHLAHVDAPDAFAALIAEVARG